MNLCTLHGQQSCRLKILKFFKGFYSLVKQLLLENICCKQFMVYKDFANKKKKNNKNEYIIGQTSISLSKGQSSSVYYRKALAHSFFLLSLSQGTNL